MAKKKVLLDDESQQIKKLALDVSPDVLKVMNGIGSLSTIEDKDIKRLSFIQNVAAPMASLAISLKDLNPDEADAEKWKTLNDHFKMSMFDDSVSGSAQLTVIIGLILVVQEINQELFDE